MNLTPRDVQLLARTLKASARDLLKVVGFYQVKTFDESERALIEERMVLPPLKTNKGYAYLGLLKHEDGRCVFLQGKKCVMYRARPRICQSFPFSFQQKGAGATISIGSFATTNCPGIGEGKPVNVAKVKLQGKSTMRDISQYKRFAKWWNGRDSKDPRHWTPLILLKSMLAFES